MKKFFFQLCVVLGVAFLFLTFPRTKVQAGIICGVGTTGCNCLPVTTCQACPVSGGSACTQNGQQCGVDYSTVPPSPALCSCSTTTQCDCCPVSTPAPTSPAGATPTPTGPGGGGGNGSCGSCSTCGGPSNWCYTTPQGGCQMDSCFCAGVGCTGGGGDPCPNDSCPGYCCNYLCMDHPCIVTADCKNPSASGAPVICHNVPGVGNYCVNANCPNNTVPGANCSCNGGFICGQPCFGPCDASSGSSCTYVDLSSGSCTGTTYCAGDKGNWQTYNPSYVRGQCYPGTGDMTAYLVGPGGQISGFSQAQIQSTCPFATLKARAHIIGPADISCTAINNSTNYATGTSFSVSPNSVTPATAQAQTSGSYVSWQSTSNTTYTMNGTPPAGGYILQNVCWTRSPTAPTSGTGNAVVVNTSSSDIVTWDFGYSLGTPWVQTRGGDVIVKNTMQSKMTSLASPRLFSVNGDGGYPGNVTYGSTGSVPYTFTSDSSDSTYGRNYVSSLNYLANEPGDGTGKDPFVIDWYKYFLYQFDLSPQSGAIADYSQPTNSITKPSGRTVPYLVQGDMVTSGDWTIGANESLVFLVSGNAIINGKITITPGGFFAIIANGNISVTPLVGGPYTSSAPVVEGFYITSPTGTFQTGQSTNAGTERLVVKGSVVAGGFLLQRSLDSVGHNADTSSELFIYNPQLLFTMPDKMKDMKITWREAAP